MEIVIKPISNRRYPPRMCANPACPNEFIPHDKRQIYCCRQCQINYNNDKREIINKPVKNLTEKLIYNEKVLKKLYDKLLKGSSFFGFLLDYEEFFHMQSPDQEMNEETGNIINWFFHYGLEPIDEEENRFKLYFRKNIPE